MFCWNDHILIKSLPNLKSFSAIKFHLRSTTILNQLGLTSIEFSMTFHSFWNFWKRNPIHGSITQCVFWNQIGTLNFGMDFGSRNCSGWRSRNDTPGNGPKGVLNWCWFEDLFSQSSYVYAWWRSRFIANPSYTTKIPVQTRKCDLPSYKILIANV